MKDPQFPYPYKKPERTLTIHGNALPEWAPPRVNIQIPEDPKPVLLPIHLHGREAIGELFSYTVRVRTHVDAPAEKTTLDLGTIRGTAVTIKIDIPGKGTPVTGQSGGQGQGNIGHYTREITGYVSEARFIRADGRSMVYEFVVEPALAKAALGSNYRIFQNQNVIDVVKELIAPYPVSVDWRINGPLYGERVYPVRDLQRQHFEADMTVIQRLCEHAGLFYWFEHGDGAHRMVIADTLGAFHKHGEAHETIRFSTGNRIDEEHIDRLEVTSRQTEGSVTVVDHDYTRPRLAQANSPLRATMRNQHDTVGTGQEWYAYANVSQPLAGAMGVYGRPNDQDNDARNAAQVRIQALACEGLRARGHGNMRGLTVGRTFHLTDHPFEPANREYLVVSATLTIEESDQTSGTGQVFRCETDFEIQPISEYFRMPLRTPWPVHTGFEYAVVTGYDGDEILTDPYNRVRLQLVPDREGKLDASAFIWVPVLQPWQGNQMGSTFVPRVGSQVILGYINGNPHMPFILGSTPNARNMPAWQQSINQWVSGFRSKMQGGFSANHLALVDTKDQLMAQLHSDHGDSRLSLGWLRHIEGNEGMKGARGEGFDLFTRMWGVLRAWRGLLLTTHAHDVAGNAKDVSATHTQLTQACGLQENMAQRARQHGAQDEAASQREVSDALKAANAAVRGKAAGGPDSFPELERPDIVMSSAANLHAAATDNTHVMAGGHVAVTAGGNVSVATGKSWLASVVGMISWFAQSGGIRMFAGKGCVELQAQNDAMALQALKDVTVTSTNGKVVITGKEEIWIGAGGSYIRIDAGGVTTGTPGKILEKGATWSKQSADSQRQVLPGPIGNTPNFIELTHQYDDMESVRNAPYKATLGDGSVVTGKLDASGFARLEGVPEGEAAVEWGEDAREWTSTAKQASRYTGTANDEQAALDLLNGLKG